MNTEEFIQKAKLIHSDKYDYSKAEYVNAKTKICIICPIHGEFWQRADIHLNGSECPKCSDKKRGEILKNISFEKFIKKASKKYDDKYDYYKVEYKSKHVPVCIICPEHGEFWQTPEAHLLRKYGCEKCGKKLQSRGPKLSTDEFIEKANKIHGNKFDYSKVEYVNNKTKVCIACPTHGEFWQKPDAHLRGAECPKCKNKYDASKNGKMCLNDFIEKAKQIHGNKYDYSKVEYVDSHTKVCIICPEHGEFWQKPCNHLNGENCKKCSIEKTHQTQRLKKKDIINRFKKRLVTYDYSLFSDESYKYKGIKQKIPIICNKIGKNGIEHGVFYQTIANHLNGQGCPICDSSKLELETNHLLQLKKINFVPEKDFDWLKNERALHLDFYLSDFNIAIECQGKQHFEGNGNFGSKHVSEKELYLYNKKIDNLKLKLCEKHGIPIEYINYNDNVEKRINEIIEKYKNKEAIVKAPPVNADD